MPRNSAAGLPLPVMVGPPPGAKAQVPGGCLTHLPTPPRLDRESVDEERRGDKPPARSPGGRNRMAAGARDGQAAGQPAFEHVIRLENIHMAYGNVVALR